MAGLIGSTTRNVMAGMNDIGAASRQYAASTISAGASEAEAVMTAGQIDINSMWQTVAREQEQADYLYQSERSKIDADLLRVQSELVSAEGQRQQKELLQSFNKSDVNIIMKAVAQGRSGATVENLRAHQRNEANRSIEIAKSITAGKKAELSAAESEALMQSKLGTLASMSSAQMSAYEQRSAASSSLFTKKSAKKMADYQRRSARNTAIQKGIGSAIGIVASIYTGGAAGAAMGGMTASKSVQ